jgi:hypothetical protein
MRTGEGDNVDQTIVHFERFEQSEKMTSAMHEVRRFDVGHEDLIHDIAYDFYGKRLIVCQSALSSLVCIVLG